MMSWNCCCGARATCFSRTRNSSWVVFLGSRSGKTAASLWPGFKHAVEVEVPLDGGEFTCGNIEITVSLADGDARTAKAKADCPD